MSESKHTPIPDYPGYEASPNGQIFSVEHNWRGPGHGKAIKSAFERKGWNVKW